MNDFVEAIKFIFDERESPAGGTQVGGSRDLGADLAAPEAVGCLASRSRARSRIPLGLWLGHKRRGGFLAINASNVGRAVPSLALIAFFVAYIGVGFTNLTLALVLLAIPPILTNAYSA